MAIRKETAQSLIKSEQEFIRKLYAAPAVTPLEITAKAMFIKQAETFIFLMKVSS